MEIHFLLKIGQNQPLLHKDFWAIFHVLSNGYFSKFLHFWMKIFDEYNEGYNHFVCQSFMEIHFLLKIGQNHKL